MTSSSLGYLLAEGGRNIKANRQMSIASIGVLVACMLLIGASVLFSLNINSIMGHIEGMNEMIVWITDDATQAVVDQLADSLGGDSNVESSVFVSKSDALAQQMELMNDAAGLLSGLEGTENPLPASFRVKLRDLAQLESTVHKLEVLDGVDYIAAPTDIATTLVDIERGVTVGGGFIVGILAMVSVIIISNTIKVTVFNRRKEINIMKYVGATDAFIRIPFLVEGVIIGLTAALLAFCCLWVSYGYVMDWMSGTTSSWMLEAYKQLVPFETVSLQLLGGFTAAGGAFGILGSLFFVNRYLKV